jgi:uncharacterized protein
MSRVVSRFLIVVMATLLATGLISLRARAVHAATPTDAFFSEYIEGTSNNKALEIYNGTGAIVDLVAGQYTIQVYFNGSATAGTTITLTGSSLADGDVWIVADDNAAAPILAVADQVSTANFFNGDDAVVLRKGGVSGPILDVIGQIGLDPGTEWGTGLTSTTDNTLRRLATTCAGDTDGSNAFDPSSEWNGFTTDTFEGLGAHTANCGGGITLSVNDVSKNESTGSQVYDFTVSLSAAAGAGGVTFDIATADNTATVADNDYIAQSLTGQSIAAGNTTYTFSVIVNGDTKFESNETFFVNVTNVSGASIADGQGTGTLVNDDPATCGDEFTPIYEIQGSGLGAAITGNVTTEGVVVGDFEGSASVGGFYVQDELSDGDSETSDGIFVFTGNADTVSAGDRVRVTGFARERFPVTGTPFGQTALNGSNSNSSPVLAANILDCGTGSVAATDVTMPFASATFPERFEGMKVRFPQELVIAEYFNYDRFGEVVLALPLDGEQRPFTGTAKDEPGAAANARTSANLLRRITLDDNRSAGNPPVLRHPNGDAFSLTNRFRGGDIVENAVGVLGFDFNLYRVFPTGPADFTSVNGRDGEPEDVGGGLRVAVMNTLNFFLTLDYPSSMPALDNKCGPLQNVECRGADFGADPTPNTVDPIIDEEFPRQRAKLLEALAGLDADVLGLNELENTTGVDPLGDPEKGIVAGLNGMGVGPYDYVDTDVIGTDAIRVGLIFRSEVVKPVGDFEILTHEDDPRFDDSRSRPALAQTFEEIATGARFTVVVNHLKSKGDSGLLGPCTDSSPDNDVPDCDQGDGQSFWNVTRTNAAKALVDWIATDPTGSGDPDFLIMGDLNSYAMEDPIDAIKAGEDQAPGTSDDWTNLIAQYVGDDAYSFVFDGQSGYLDHALANPSIVSQVAGATEWHINADEPDILDYDVSFKPQAQDALFEVNQFRTSDHDPVLLGLDLINEAPTIEITAGSSCSGTGGTFEVSVDDNEVAAGDLTLSLEGNTNASLVTNVAFGGSGASRSVTVTVADKQIGTAMVTIGVNDGFQTATTTIAIQAGGDTNDAFVGTSDADLLLGNQGGDTLTGLGGADVLCGGQGADLISGGDDNDAVDGSQGTDVLSGGNGNDRLSGGQGDDALTGGAGADSFSGGPGSDVNADFNSGDGDTSDGT